MPTSLAKGIRQAARDQEAARLSRDNDVPADTTKPEESTGARRVLGNAPIRYKLWAILVVPLAAVLLFATLQINASTAEASSAQQVQGLAKLGVKISALAHELQQERGRAANLLGSRKSADEFTYESQYRATDSAISSYREEKDALSGDTAAPVLDSLSRVEEQLRSLTVLRRSIVSQAVAQAQATFRYTTLISDLLAINEAIADATDDTSVADRVRATAAFSRLKEFVSQEEAILFEVLAEGKFQPGQYRDFINSLANQEAHLVQFAASATPEQRKLMDQTLTRPLVEDSTRLEQIAIKGENATKLDIGERSWFAAMTKKINLLRQVEIQLGRNVVNVSGALRDDAMRQSMVNIGLVLLTLVAALTISLLVARSMVRPLVQLRSSALEVANHSLPEVVRRLRDTEDAGPEAAGQRPADSPGGVDPELVQAVEIKSNDEIGQVARAFNAVHLEAVRVATEQAQLRRSVSTMFVNLSRRSQLLVDRLIRLIDNLEQGEQDPDRLSDLFKLDHLATRMRRNDENLLVLAGADAGRRWNQPAPLVDVLRAATAEVEQYTRVRLGSVDESIEVAARAVNDIVHLVAELLENATSFSSPRTDVIVDARRVGDQAIIEIEDQGIGMSRQQMTELNERLTKPPVFDVSVSRMMGLFVVGRLANRHNVKVMLRGASSGGTLAIVTLSAEVLNLSRFQRPTLAGADQPQALPAGSTIDSTVVEPASPAAVSGPPAAPALPAGSPFEPPAQRPAEEKPAAPKAPAPAEAAAAKPAETRPEPAPAAGPAGPSTAAAAMAVLSSQPSAVDRTNGTPTPQFLSSPSDPASADPTVEMPLPIFDAIESEWFRTKRASMEPPEPTTAEAAATMAESARAAKPAARAPEPTAAGQPASPAKAQPARPAAARTEATDATAVPAAASQDPTTNGAAVTGAGAGEAGRENEADRYSRLHSPAPSAPGLPTRQPGASEPSAPARPATPPVAPAAAAPATPAAQRPDVDRLVPTASAGTTGSTGNGTAAAEPPSWKSAADAGWQAAQAAAEAQAEASTPSGLPKRVPMANFVPGRVEPSAQRRPARPTPQRSPDAVRGVLSSYRSGLEQGRQATRARHAVATEVDEQEEM